MYQVGFAYLDTVRFIRTMVIKSGSNAKIIGS